VPAGHPFFAVFSALVFCSRFSDGSRKICSAVWVFSLVFPTVREKFARPSGFFLSSFRRFVKNLLDRLVSCSYFSDGSQKNFSSVCFPALISQTVRRKISFPSVYCPPGTPKKETVADAIASFFVVCFLFFN
jgi:hypothetical protein